MKINLLYFYFVVELYAFVNTKMNLNTTDNNT